jgi:hypothetical protein
MISSRGRKRSKMKGEIAKEKRRIKRNSKG